MVSNRNPDIVPIFEKILAGGCPVGLAAAGFRKRPLHLHPLGRLDGSRGALSRTSLLRGGGEFTPHNPQVGVRDYS